MVKEAEELLKKEGATGADFARALENLKKAKAALSTEEPAKADKTKLTAAVAEAEKVNKADYTDDSVKSFEQALTAAKAVLEDTYATQAEVDAAVNTLKQAADALVKKTTPTPDPTPTPNPNPTPTPNPAPGKDDTAKVPAKGSKFTDKKTGLVYKVTRSDAKNGTVTVTGTTAAKKNAKKVTIPATVVKDGYTFKVTAISAKAFQNRKKLSSVVIGANVTKIGAKAFYKDAKLKNITFKGNKAVKAGKNAFKGIKANAKVTVPYKISKKNLNKIKKAVKSAGKKVVIKKKDIIIPY